LSALSRGNFIKSGLRVSKRGLCYFNRA